MKLVYMSRFTNQRCCPPVFVRSDTAMVSRLKAVNTHRVIARPQILFFYGDTDAQQDCFSNVLSAK